MKQIISPQEETHTQQIPGDVEIFSSKPPLDQSDFGAAQMKDLAKAAELAFEIQEGKYDRQYTLSSKSKLGLTDFIKSNTVPKPGNSALREIVNHFRFTRKGRNIELIHAEKSIFSIDLTQEQMKSPELIFSIVPPNSSEGDIGISILSDDDNGMNEKAHIISCEDFFKNFTFFQVNFETRKDTPLLNSFGVSIDEKNKEEILKILNTNSSLFKGFKNVKLFAKKYSIEDLENLEFHFQENALFLGSVQILTLISGQSLNKITIRPNSENTHQIDLCVTYNDRRSTKRPFSQIKTYDKGDFIAMIENTKKIKA